MYYTGATEFPQPVLTPPHLHRWAKRMTANTFAVKELPLLSAGSDLEIMFRKRKKNWMDRLPVVDWTEPYALHQLSAPIRYIDERHYEVFKMGHIPRSPGGGRT